MKPLSSLPKRFSEAMELVISKKEITGKKIQVKNRRAFAELLEVDPSKISQIERGLVPTVKQIYDLCSKTGVNPTWLILGTGEPFESKPTLEKRIEAIEKKLKI